MIENRIGDLIMANWRELQPLQPDNAKYIYNYQDIENSIRKYGFAVPFYVWVEKGKYYCIDGHTRKEVLSNMEGVPDELPAIEIKAKNRKEAVKVLIEVYNQKHNPFVEDVLVEMIEAESIDIEEIDLGSVNVKGDKPGDEPKEEENKLGIYPLSVVLNAKEYKDFQLYKKENGHRSDTDAFKELFKYKLIAE